MSSNPHGKLSYGQDSAPRTRRTWRLRTILILLVLLLLAGFGACIAVGSYIAMSSYLTNQVDQQLQRSVRGPQGPEREVPRKAPSSGHEGTPPNPLTAPGQGEGILTLRIAEGKVDDDRSGWVSQSREKRAFAIEDVRTLEQVSVDAGPSDQQLSIGSYRVKAVTDREGGTVVVGLPLEARNNTLASLQVIIAVAAGIGLLLCGLVGTLLIRRSLRPLERVSQVAHQVADLPLNSGEVAQMARVDVPDSETEVGRVGFALNRMLNNVEGALAARQSSEMQVRQFVADASHELRTPLTSIRGYSDLVQRTEQLSQQGEESMQRVSFQAGRMQQLVDDLLLLARYDEGRELVTERVDLVELVVETGTDMEIADVEAAHSSGQEGHRWVLDVPETELPETELWVQADPVQLRRAVENLLSNAKKHTSAGTTITMGVQAEPDAGEGSSGWSSAGVAVLTVHDDGEGIPEEFLPEIFSRFARADKARSGQLGTVGLGLPIVQAIVAAHGGEISVQSQPGGTSFIIRLPLAQA